MRQIIIRIDADDFTKLRQLATHDDRPVDRQAAYLLRQALADRAADAPRDLALAGPARPEPGQVA